MKYIIKLENEITLIEYEQLENLLVPLFSFSYHFKKSYQENHTLYFSSKPKWRLFVYDRNELVGSLSIVERNIAKPFPLTIAGIGNLGVRKDYQSKGLALEMLDQAHKFTKGNNADLSLLFCIPRLSGLYVKAGYTKLKKPVIYTEHRKTQTEPTAFAYPLLISKSVFYRIIDSGLTIGEGSW